MDARKRAEIHINDMDDLYDEIDSCLSRDDCERFIKIFRIFQPPVSNCLLNMCISSGAKKCVTAFLSGEVFPDLSPMVANADLVCDVVTHFPDPDILDLVLTRCGGASYVDTPSLRFTPFEACLCDLSFVHPLYNWSKGDSFVKLFILLCHSTLRHYLESARVLAKYSNAVNKFAWEKAKAGHLGMLGASLLVAREKVMLPFPTGMTVKDLITKETARLSSDNKECLENEYSNLGEALKLFDIFERVGDALSSYYASMPKNASDVDMVTDVARMFEKAGFSLTDEDLNVSYWFSRLGVPEDDDERFGIFAGITSKSSSAEENECGSPFIIPGSVLSINPSLLMGRRLQQPSTDGTSALGVRGFCTYQTNGGWLYNQRGDSTMVTKPLSVLTTTASTQIAHPNPALKYLAYMAGKLKKGIRYI